MGYRQLRRAAVCLCRIAFVCAGVAALPVRGWAQPTAAIVVTVTEPDGAERSGWPLTFGLPWPAGALRDPSVSVQEQNGTALPVQTRVLSTWRDGSVRWLLVDTQVTLAPHQSKRLTVARAVAHPPAPRHELRVQESEERIAIDTGALRFAIPRHRFAIAEAIEAAGGKQTSGPITAVLQRAETPLAARSPRHVSILERGPLRVRVQLEGEYGDGFDYLIRVEAYAGQPQLHVLHTFINRDPADSVRVPRISIDWPVRTALPASYSTGVDDSAAQSGDLTDAGLRFVQVDNETWRVGEEDRPGKLAGWFSLGAGDHAIGLAARWFWQQYPQSVLLTPERLTYNLWAPEAVPAAAVGMGAAKTHELTFWVGAAGRRALPSAARPLIAAVDSSWIAHSGALPQAITADRYNGAFLKSLRGAFDRYMQRNASERWDDRGSVHCEGMFAERPRIGAYGMWNWGDWNFPKYQDQTKGCDAWGNLEYDTSQVLALGFAATGDSQMYDALTAAARHFMDVDTIHFQRRHPEWVGMNHPKNPLHFSFELGGIDLGHTWSEGLLSYYYLTGDERGLEAARAIADYLVRRSRGSLALANPRQLGWPQIALLAVYEATGDRTYLESAHVYARRAIALFNPAQVPHWKHGVLADALAYTHAATGDTGLEQWLRTYAHTISHRPRQGEPRFLPAVAYVARVSNDAHLRALVLAGVHQIDLGGWGKPFTIGGRLAFRIYSLLAEPPGRSHAVPTSAPARAKPAGKKASSKKAR